MELLPRNGKMPLLVVHTQGHLDHRAGDAQFASVPSTKLVSSSLEPMRAFFGVTNWPDGIAQVDLGNRTVDVIPTPGHDEAQFALNDRRTGILFSGDFLLPGRLTIEDSAAFYRSAARVADFREDAPYYPHPRWAH